jgi:putative peptide zinc metalloprotease protein
MSLERRAGMLAGVLAFAGLPEPMLEQMARNLIEEAYAAGSTLITEGEIGDRLFLIVRGRVEVSTKGTSGSIPLETRGADEVVGDIALLSPSGRRTATVTALTDLLALSLDASIFHSLLSAYPAVKTTFADAADTTLKFKFLKQASPFTTLDREHLCWLAARLECVAVPADCAIIQQGEPGDTCYLLLSGRAEVLIRQDDGAERRLETYGPGRLFGEMALLSGGLRNATIRAVEPCELLALHRDELLEAMRVDRTTGGRIIDLVHLRDRPRQSQGVLAYHRTTSEGETVTTLKDPRRGAYYRLSPQGWFIWQRLDGQHTIRDLSLEYMIAFKSFAPQMIAGLVGSLIGSGFAEGARLCADVQADVTQLSMWERTLRRARRLLTYRFVLENLDSPISSLYQGGIHLLYTWRAQIVLAALALGGLGAFGVAAVRVGTSISSAPGGASLLIFLIPAFLISVLLHEAGHIFTTKAFGHEVNRAGIGWYWLGPIVFVDTSDMWLAGRWARIAVSLAGSYTNLITGGIGALVALVSPDPVITASLWQFAFASYIMVLGNLNPLLEFDGYYVLMDVLERPNLREHAFAWLRDELPRAWRVPSRLRQHWVELVYGLASLVYIVLLAVLTVISYRILLQDWIARILPVPIAFGLAWAFAAAVIALYALGIAAELRGAPRRVQAPR